MAKRISAPGDDNQACNTHFVAPGEPQTPSQDDFELSEKVSAWDAKQPGGSTFSVEREEPDSQKSEDLKH